MKKNIPFLLFTLLAFSSFGQNRFPGIWKGKINAGVELRAFFTIEQDSTKKGKVTMDFPDQGVKGLITNDVTINDDSIVIKVKEFNGSYSGKLINDTTIAGFWKQGVTIALELKKVNQVDVVKKPQTPVPPFPYKSEDVIYKNKNGSIQYGATITIPSGKGPFPAIVLITGSGTQNRDGEILGHKPFAVIADYLTRNGFVVLRVDDRGAGKTTGDIKSATSFDFSNDVSTGLDYLISRREVKKKKLGLIGHSEGGMIAPILAAKRKDVAAIVLLAGPGKNPTEVMIEQNNAYYSSIGLKKEFVESYVSLYSSIIYIMKKSVNIDSSKNKVTTEVDSWLLKTAKNIVVATTGITNDEKKITFVNSLVETFGTPWFHYFLNYEPERYIKKLTCKVFALNGSKDIQVLPKSNLAAFDTALKRSKSRGYQIKEYEGLNHLFQKCKSCTAQEYGSLEESFSTDVLKDITAWLTKEM
jgi:pimeloyl-ACP methyl ester carboxylesterase